jgi:hypothetical protein
MVFREERGKGQFTCGHPAMEALKEIAAVVTDMLPTYSHCPSAAHQSPVLFLGMEKSVLQLWQLPIPVERTLIKKL